MLVSIFTIDGRIDEVQNRRDVLVCLWLVVSIGMYVRYLVCASVSLWQGIGANSNSSLTRLLQHTSASRVH